MLLSLIPGNVKIGILAAWALVTIALSWGLYESIQATATAKAATQVATDALAEQVREFEGYKGAVDLTIAKGREANAMLQNQYTKAQGEVNELHKLFAEHNIEKIAYRKPITFTRIINRGSIRVFRNLEDITNPGRLTAENSDKTGETDTDTNP